MSLRRVAALVALLAITLQALWPLLAQARPRDPSLQVPICTVDGSAHFIDLDTGKTVPHEHCKLCLMGTDKALEAPAVPGLQVAERRDQSVDGSASSFSPAPLCVSARPRAPPVIS
jgi:hypothetical protein